MTANSRSLIAAIRGPIMLITIGTLFALDHTTSFTFWRTWPAILIILGLLNLAERLGTSGPAGDAQ
ncbi:MAG: DUF5668 domain-containing protein [Bryobacteraceae bacterium]